MPKKPVILPPIGEGFDDVFSTLIHDPKNKKRIDKKTESSDDIKCSEVNMSKSTIKLPHATYHAPLKLGNIELEAAVLDNETRVLSRASVYRAFGRQKRGLSIERKQKATIQTNSGVLQVPSFMAANNIISLLDSTIYGVLEPIIYEQGGNRISGYKAEIIPEVCNLYLRARREQILAPQQEGIAQQAEILLLAIAKVGIIALVDESTGFQKDRSNTALQILLQQYVEDGIKAWIKTFPDEFFKQLDKLYSKNKTTSRNRPKYYGRFINTYIYDPIEKGYIKKELDKRNIDEDGKRKARFHQWLTKFGKDQLLIQLGRVMGVMEGCNRIESFRRKMEHMKDLSIAPELFDNLDELEDQNAKGQK